MLITFRHISGSYRTRLLLCSDSDNEIILQFDTGAVNTVISIDTAFGGDYSKIQKVRQEIEQEIQSGIYDRYTFHSASGHEMYAVLVRAENVLIGNEKISEFYFYMIYNIDSSIALLGDDFLAYCQYVHDIKGDIEIERYYPPKTYIDKNGNDISFTRAVNIIKLL